MKELFCNRTSSVVVHGRKVSVLQGTAVKSIPVIQTDISVHKDTGLRRHNEYAWSAKDNRQIILGHKDIDRNSRLCI